MEEWKDETENLCTQKPLKHGDPFLDITKN